ncbi:MAG: hypothetical protein DRJ65_00015 [Acidobacteria bacterium]|nr:MAG: hypothetical protein DRJ65_00015 [Acidobacteriota bacterium]
MSDTKIEWTEKTWNPVIGCSKVSAGCANCYALRMAARMASNPATPQYQGVAEFGQSGPRWLSVKCLPEKLAEPLKRRKPTMYFVNSMSDLFHEDVPDDFITAVWNVMRKCPQHTFQILTKRPERMASIVQRLRFDNREGGRVFMAANADDPESGWSLGVGHLGCSGLVNVWLGVSVEDQAAADERVPYLLNCPAAVRFVSCEPLLGAVNLREMAWQDDWSINSLDTPDPSCRVHWVIVGGESGPKARPMHPGWARSIGDQCQEAGVPFFFKQWGAFCAPSQMPADIFRAWDHDHGTECWDGDDPTPWCVGKKAAGRLLDGREWNETPGGAG